MYSLRQFKKLAGEAQVEQLNSRAVPLDLAHTAKGTEAVLFAYNGFYVELVVEKYADAILAVKCFKSLKRLEPYLHQVDISEITDLLSCRR
jgi:hypothetical protein